MLKINLSDRRGNEKNERESEDTVVQPTVEISEQSTNEKTVEKSVKGKKKISHRTLYLVVILLVAVAAALAFYQKDMILSLLPKKAEKAVSPPAQTPAPPEVEPVVPEEPDPIFIALNRISEVIPERIWLSSAIINYNGSYEINGIAFTHSAMGALADALGAIGSMSERIIPAKSKSSETVYNFSIRGAIGDINVPEILDIIPTDGLISLVDPIVKRSKEFEVKFNNIPKTGQSYSDKDLPFALEGSYESLKNVISELCPVNGDIRVYRIVILPATTGRLYDRIKASFSLRTVSSI
ncbi:MAG TPA: hypothetical protein VMZ04_06475 [Anaerolineae bacterium]|nr:hypothetical protein [Anaerolineae bacterium]